MGEKISARLHQELASLHYALWLSPVSAGLFEKMGVSILLHDKGQQRGHTHFLKLPVGPTVYSCKSTQNVRDLHVVMLTIFSSSSPCLHILACRGNFGMCRNSPGGTQGTHDTPCPASSTWCDWRWKEMETGVPGHHHSTPARLI